MNAPYCAASIDAGRSSVHQPLGEIIIGREIGIGVLVTTVVDEAPLRLVAADAHPDAHRNYLRGVEQRVAGVHILRRVAVDEIGHAVAARIVGRAVAVDVVARIDAELHLQVFDAAQDFLVDERGCAASAAQQLRAQCGNARAAIRIPGDVVGLHDHVAHFALIVFERIGCVVTDEQAGIDLRRDAFAVDLQLRGVRVDAAGSRMAQHQYVSVDGLAAAFGGATQARVPGLVVVQGSHGGQYVDREIVAAGLQAGWQAGGRHRGHSQVARRRERARVVPHDRIGVLRIAVDTGELQLRFDHGDDVTGVLLQPRLLFIDIEAASRLRLQRNRADDQEGADRQRPAVRSC